MREEKKERQDKSGDHKYTLAKNGPAVSTFYEPSETPEKLKETLYYLNKIYKHAAPGNMGK